MVAMDLMVVRKESENGVVVMIVREEREIDVVDFFISKK